MQRSLWIRCSLRPLSEAMNVAVAISPLLDGRLQHRVPSGNHAFVTNLGSGDVNKRRGRLRVQSQLVAASSIADGADAAAVGTAVNKFIISGVVQDAASGFDHEMNSVVQMVLRVDGEEAPLVVRSVVQSTGKAFSASSKYASMSKKDKRSQRRADRASESAARSDATSACSSSTHDKRVACASTAFVTGLIGKHVLVEGSLRVFQRYDPDTNVKFGFPALVIPHRELEMAVTVL